MPTNLGQLIVVSLNFVGQQYPSSSVLIGSLTSSSLLRMLSILIISKSSPSYLINIFLGALPRGRFALDYEL